MGRDVFTTDDYARARRTYNVTRSTGVTHQAEEEARRTGRLSAIVDPAFNPIRVSTIRLDEYGPNPTDAIGEGSVTKGQWIATVGCPMDIELQCDTTGSMGSEVDTEMAILPDLYAAVAKVLPGYDPQLCLGIFGDCDDPFVLCRPQFEMRADRIVEYLKEMAPQRRGGGNDGEDPQYAMFARAYLTDAYTNRIGLKGYHFIVTDEPCHPNIRKSEVKRIFGKEIFDKELEGLRDHLPSVDQTVEALKSKAHTFALIPTRHILGGAEYTIDSWRRLYGRNRVITIETTRDLPSVISAIIGLTEGTLDIAGLDQLTEGSLSKYTLGELSQIDLAAQVKLRHALPHPVPKKGDIFANKGDLWPIGHCSNDATAPEEEAASKITYF